MIAARPNPCVLEVALDTNAFSTIFDARRDLARRAAGWVKRNRVRFILPQTMLVEAFSGDAAATLGKLKSLRTFCAAVPLADRHVGVSATLSRLMAIERKAVRSGSAPVHTQTRLDAVLATADSPDLWDAATRDRLRQSLGHKLWAALQQEARENQTPRTIDVMVRGIEVNIRDLRQAFAPDIISTEHIPRDSGPDPFATARRICSDPWAHRAHALYSGLLWLLLTSGTLRGRALIAHQELARTDPNDTIDVNIASAAAYCPAFVTSDASLAHRLRLLRTAGLAFVFTVPTQTIVELIEQETI